MLRAYQTNGQGLRALSGDDLTGAIWVDLYRPLDAQVAQVQALGVEVPTLADMEEIEISNRLYHDNGVDYMTAVLPGELPDGTRVASPVTFILTPQRLITVRHHQPRPFVTFPERAGRASLGCASADRLFLGLIEDIIARLADLLEGSGKVLDATAKGVFADAGGGAPAAVLQDALQTVGLEAEVMARVRLGLLTIERILTYHSATSERRSDGGRIKALVKAQLRDIQALEVHADFLSSRVGLTVDATMGLINLQQNNTVRILSVVAALFLPPTLIASIYGMNFHIMPELDYRWGYPMALGLMAASGVASYLFLWWKKWL